MSSDQRVGRKASREAAARKRVVLGWQGQCGSMEPVSEDFRVGARLIRFASVSVSRKKDYPSRAFGGEREIGQDFTL